MTLFHSTKLVILSMKMTSEFPIFIHWRVTFLKNFKVLFISFINQVTGSEIVRRVRVGYSLPLFTHLLTHFENVLSSVSIKSLLSRFPPPGFMNKKSRIPSNHSGSSDLVLNEAFFESASFCKNCDSSWILVRASSSKNCRTKDGVSNNSALNDFKAP